MLYRSIFYKKLIVNAKKIVYNLGKKVNAI